MILDRYILKNHFIPFVYATLSLMGIFLLQFLMRFADRLVGKGLSLWVIIKLISYNLAWMVVLVIPMATLIASLMAFGNMSQNDEVTIFKSTGVSLYRMIVAPILASFLLAYFLFLFNDNVLPDANHKAKVLMEDISRQKPTLSLTPGIFSQEISNYAILVRGINSKTNELSNVLIYSYKNPVKLNIITAKKGRIFFSKDQYKLVMELQNGEIHESDLSDKNVYRKILFKRHRILMNSDKFTFQQSGPGGRRGDRELSTTAMNAIIDSIEIIKKNYSQTLNEHVNNLFYQNEDKNYTLLPSISKTTNVYTNAIEKVETTKNIIIANINRSNFLEGRINGYLVEIYKKYALPFANIVFVLIGVPLGIKVKKGGFGVAASISLFFFLIYWASLIGGEKLGNRDIVSPFLGMWGANIIIGIFGIVLIIKTVKETKIIQVDKLRKLIPYKWRITNKQSDEVNR